MKRQSIFRRLRFATLVLFLLSAIAVTLPRVQAGEEEEIARCATNRTYCRAEADANYNSCMNSPMGNYVVCSAWWYWDMTGCMEQAGCG